VVLHLPVLELTGELVDNAGGLQRERRECLRVIRAHDLFLQFADDVLQFADLPVLLVDGLVHLAAGGVPLPEYH
jgi:hypothetical protein